MTEEERIHNLRGFGYTTEEARFLGIVALHSGYFLRRQFDAAIGVERGKRTSAFVTYLRHYKGLFQAIGEFDLVYAGTQRALFGTPEKTFHRVLSGLGGQTLIPRDLCRLLAYFHDWNLFERGQSRVLSLERMNSLREDRAEFGSPFHDSLFDLWKKGGEPAVRTEIGIKNLCQGRFSRHVFPFDYDLFGALEVAS